MKKVNGVSEGDMSTLNEAVQNIVDRVGAGEHVAEIRIAGRKSPHSIRLLN